MKQRKMTKAELSRRSGLSDALISKILNEENPNPTKETLERLAEGLGVSVAMFFVNENHYVTTVTDFLLPHLTHEEVEFIMSQDSKDFIILAQEAKASDLPADILRKVIESYIKMAKNEK